MKIVTRMIDDELYEASNGYGNNVLIDMRSPRTKLDKAGAISRGIATIFAGSRIVEIGNHVFGGGDTTE